ncbi:diacylglycerol kinase family lipid kinase [Fontisphaera persica]|uniref:diacylglycerol/lipid kinase family protein n=1 Tax=Fontisphaera persica TaxID=2974023 RepID=UPI0024C0AE5A|nr:diacylglycerol kinase family protein [Fontisphaera persica]WCJ60659.1 diacylglycerol kinase family lipid kinase [Fontisphaera persica]
MHACIIFNPRARGGSSPRMQERLRRLAGGIRLMPTPGPGGARELAKEAVAGGFDTVIATGGDGTLNEIVNGLAEVPGAFQQVRLGVLPVGTANVFARELALPFRLEKAWEIVLQGREIQVDLGVAEFQDGGAHRQRLFLQLGGAGLDARAIELLNQRLKKRLGPLAYVWAGVQAMRENRPRLRITAGENCREVELALLGNGRRYGGPFPLFPYASLKDGRLDATLFPQTNWSTLWRVAQDMWAENWNSLGGAVHWQAEVFHLEPLPDARVPFELDGERVGLLPAVFRVFPQRLRVIC